MNKLIKITTNEEGKQLVSARELHEFLESGQDFTTWIKNRIEKYEFVEDEDFTLHKFMVGKVWKHNVEGSRHNEENLGGRPTLDFAISLDFAK